MRLRGIEPPHMAPEAIALSTELQTHLFYYTRFLGIARGTLLIFQLDFVMIVLLFTLWLITCRWIMGRYGYAVTSTERLWTVALMAWKQGPFQDGNRDEEKIEKFAEQEDEPGSETAFAYNGSSADCYYIDYYYILLFCLVNFLKATALIYHWLCRIILVD